MNLPRNASRRWLISLLLAATPLCAQAVPTAAESLQLSAFGGVSGVYTGLNSGRNLSITAGADLSLRRYFHVNPALEVRGTFPVDNGKVDGQRNVLGGLRFTGSLGRLHPYGDVLFGRGEIKYNPPLLNSAGTFLYAQSTSNVLSFGGGVEYDLSPHFALRGDVQAQRYAFPVVNDGPAAPVPVVAGSSSSNSSTYGHLLAVPITAALTYRFDFNRHAIGRHR